MMQRFSFLLVALIFLHLAAASQQQKFVKNYLAPQVNALRNSQIRTSHGYVNIHSGSLVYKPVNHEKYLPLNLQLPNYETAPQQMDLIESDASLNIPSVYHYSYFDPIRDWGIICRKEWQLEKMTGVPFRFRLGSVEYVDRLEAKTK
jgi:hypothetical protein